MSRLALMRRIAVLRLGVLSAFVIVHHIDTY